MQKKIDDHYEVFTHGGRNATGINAIEMGQKKWLILEQVNY